jgi:diguanylate cyclase (GGDEF)-like protein
LWHLAGNLDSRPIAADVEAVMSSRARRLLAEAEARANELQSKVDELDNQLAAANAALTSKLAEPAPAPIAAAAGAADASLMDPATGLFNEPFFRVTLNSRVSAARRHLRPVAVVLMQVASGVKEGTPTLTDPAIVAGGIQVTLRDADTACRLSDGRYAFVLEDTPENGAVWSMERLRRLLAERGTPVLLWAGVAAYPAHALEAVDLLSLAEQALADALQWTGQSRIEVALPE